MDAKGPGFASMALISCFSPFQIVELLTRNLDFNYFFKLFLPGLMGLASLEKSHFK